MTDYMEIARKHLASKNPPPETGGNPLADVLAGRAVCLYSDLTGDHIWIVADEQDAVRLGEPRGTVYDASEVRLICRIDDPAMVRELHEWKRMFNGTLTGLRDKRDIRGNSGGEA